jgi:hypothetical protein
MELKTQALDRALQALSPALAAELERVVQETRETLEQEFERRLQAAVRETETATTAACAIQLDRAVGEVKEETRKQVSEELEQQFQTRLNDAAARLNNEAAVERAKFIDAATKQKNEAAADRANLQEQLEQWQVFAEAQRQLAEASSQFEILSRFLKLAQPFADGLAVYVTKADGLALWRSRGKGAFPEIISKETMDPESYFKTITVRGKPVAAVCAASSFKVEALDFLVASLEHAVEVFGLKLRTAVPKSVLSETTVAVSSTPAGATVPTAAATLGPEDQKAHAEARRTARLLVSEIKLYHEQELDHGRRNGDIYQRLQKEIDLGRESYSQRVPGGVLGSHDYFHEELVRILGENDASRLGAAYPGPMKA